MAATAQFTDSTAALEAWLAEQTDKGLLRFLTCGSVDDGKSTLIGRQIGRASCRERVCYVV